MTEGRAPSDISSRSAARAIDALRRGWPVSMVSGEDSLHLISIETAQDVAFEEQSDAPAELLISSARAETLKLANQRAAADVAAPVRVKVAEPLTASLAMAIADPVLDMKRPMKGPFLAVEIKNKELARAAMELARHATILPAFLIVSSVESDTTSVTPEDIANFADAGKLSIATRAKLPVAANEEAEIIAFRSDADATDHIALVVGKRDSSVPLVRLHSECLTGDVLGSLKCDCGPQLHDALGRMTKANWGVLLYLRQEGRGIGLINKLRAYALQDQGFDTVDANNRLGFATEARDFSVASHMLMALGIESIKLLTNNPEKVTGIEAAGVNVAERVPIKIVANPYNEHYLDTKRDRTGHKL